MGFLLFFCILILLRRYEAIEITTYQIIICSLLAEAITALYLIAAIFVKRK